MKYIIYSVLIVLLGITSISCSTFKKEGEYIFHEEVTDSILVSSPATITAQFVYSTSKNILMKSSKVAYLQEIISMKSGLEEGAYQEAYEELQQLIENKFMQVDSIDLDRIKSSKVAIYPLIELVTKQKLYIYDMNTQEVQDSIYKKSYVRQKFDKSGNILSTFSGESYTTVAGEEFIRVMYEKD